MKTIEDARFLVPPHVHTRRFDDDTVLLNLESGEYFALDAVGQAIWEALAKGLSLGEVVAQIAQSYEVDRPTAMADAERLAGELVARGLLRPREG